MATNESIRQRFLSCMRVRQGSKQSYTLKVKDHDISIKVEMLPTSTRPEDVRELARKIGCKSSVKDEDGMLVGTGGKTFGPGESAAGIVDDMITLSRGLTAEGENLARENGLTEEPAEPTRTVVLHPIAPTEPTEPTEPSRRKGRTPTA